MKNLILATTTLTLMAAPAQAQLLGNGSLTGNIGSALDVQSTILRTTETVRTTTSGAIEGAASTQGDQNIDRRSGRVETRRSAEANGAASLTQLAVTPIMPIGAGASGSGSASGEGEAQAQLIGTDAVRGTAVSTVGAARGAVGSLHGTTASLAGEASGVAGSLPGSVPTAPNLVNGSASGEGSASGDGSASLTSAPLAVAGTAASAASGAASIAPGMPVVTPEGLPMGKVRQIVANSRGEVEQVTVSDGESEQVIPAGSLFASGNALVTGEGSANAETNPPNGDDEG